MTRASRSIGWFRSIKDPQAAKRAIEHRTVFCKSDERCRYEVKKQHVRGPCGKGTTMCVANTWYCRRHGTIMQNAESEASSAAEQQIIIEQDTLR